MATNWRDPHPEDFTSPKRRNSPRRASTEEKSPPTSWLSSTTTHGRAATFAAAIALVAATTGLWIGRQEVARFENSVTKYSKEVEEKLHAVTQQNELLQKQLTASKAAETDAKRLQGIAEDKLRLATQPKPKPDPEPVIAPDKVKNAKRASTASSSP